MIETNRIIQGDCLEMMKTFPDECIDSVITSPPYYQLRDYGWTGQWGLEKTYQEYLDHLIELMKECKRVLKPMGTMWINLGDSYMNNSSYCEEGRCGYNNDKIGMMNKSDDKIKQKSLMLIPHRFAIRCIDELGLILRNDVIWAKRNGMPESVTDRFSKKHEFFFFFVKQQKYYFDLDAIRDDHKQCSIDRNLRGISENNKWVNGADGQSPHNLSKPRKNITTKIPENQCEMYGSPRARQHREQGESNFLNPLGKNPGDVSDFWDIPTQPSSEKHYATFNTKLIDKPIIAGSPKDGIVLDPFCGTGTTIVRAIELGRKAVGIEGSESYCKISQKRIEDYQKQEVMKF